MKKRLAWIMIAALIISLMPSLALAEGTGKAIQLGVSGILGGQASSVYFGSYQQRSAGNSQPSGTENVDWIKSNTAIHKSQGPYYYIDPIKWWVLSNADGQLFLLSDKSLDVCNYHEEKESVTWATSTIRSWLNGLAENKGSGNNAIDYKDNNFLDAAFSGKEQMAIANTAVINEDNPDYGTEGGNDTTDKIFLLSIAEVRNKQYFTDDNRRITTNTAYVAGGGKMGSSKHNIDATSYWWLRSSGKHTSQAATALVHNEEVSSSGNNVVHQYIVVRPAVNLSTSEVLFTSAAAGGKADTEGDNDLTAVSDYTGNEWKLTLLDASRNGFAATANTAKGNPGDTIQITYNGAQTGSNEYVSAIIADSSDNILYYGRIANNSASGTATLTIPADLEADSYTLKVFSEQLNGDKKTDYASEFQTMELSVEQPKPTGNGISVTYNGGNTFATSKSAVPTAVEIDGVPVSFAGDGKLFTVSGIPAGAKWVTVRWNSTSVTVNFTPNGAYAAEVEIPKTGDMSVVAYAVMAVVAAAGAMRKK